LRIQISTVSQIIRLQGLGPLCFSLPSQHPGGGLIFREPAGLRILLSTCRDRLGGTRGLFLDFGLPSCLKRALECMEATDLSETVLDMRRETIGGMVDKAIPENAYPEQWDLPGLEKRVRDVLGLDLPVVSWGKEEGIDEVQVRERIEAAADQAAAAKAANLGPDFMRMVEKSLLLQLFDQVWKEHLLQLDHLRQGIGLRA
jgi:hypothetical protein